jgi:hypothetical protein
MGATYIDRLIMMARSMTELALALAVLLFIDLLRNCAWKSQSMFYIDVACIQI